MQPTPASDTPLHPRFHLRPLVLCASGFASGIFLAYRTEGMSAFFAACLFFCCGILACHSRKALYAILFLSIAAGMLRMMAAMPALPNEGSYALCGTLADEPQTADGRTYAILCKANLDEKPVTGRILLYLPEKAKVRLHAGDTIAVEASLRIPKKTPGEGFDPRAYYLSEGITAHAYAKAMPQEIAHHISPRYRLTQLRRHIHDALSLAYDEEAALAAALLMNDKTYLSENVANAFRNAGVAHILALSGLHVSIFVSILAAILPKRLPRIRFLLVTAFLAVYCIIADFPPSLIRASVMSLFALAASIKCRRYDGPSALAAALLLILLFSPASLFSVGLQLSFTATAAIFMLRRPIEELFLRFPNHLRSGLSVTLAGTAGTFPLTILYFSQLPLYTLIANLLIVPLMSVLLPLVLFGAVAALASPALTWCALPAKHLLSFLRLMTEEFAALPFAVLHFNAPPAISLLPLYGAMLMLSPYHLRSRKEKLVSAALFLALSAAALVFSLFFMN